MKMNLRLYGQYQSLDLLVSVIEGAVSLLVSGVCGWLCAWKLWVRSCK